MIHTVHIVMKSVEKNLQVKGVFFRLTKAYEKLQQTFKEPLVVPFWLASVTCFGLLWTFISASICRIFFLPRKFSKTVFIENAYTPIFLIPSSFKSPKSFAGKKNFVLSHSQNLRLENPLD